MVFARAFSKWLAVVLGVQGRDELPWTQTTETIIRSTCGLVTGLWWRQNLHGHPTRKLLTTKKTRTNYKFEYHFLNIWVFLWSNLGFVPWGLFPHGSTAGTRLCFRPTFHAALGWKKPGARLGFAGGKHFWGRTKQMSHPKQLAIVLHINRKGAFRAKNPLSLVDKKVPSFRSCWQVHWDMTAFDLCRNLWIPCSWLEHCQTNLTLWKVRGLRISCSTPWCCSTCYWHPSLWWICWCLGKRSGLVLS